MMMESLNNEIRKKLNKQTKTPTNKQTKPWTGKENNQAVFIHRHGKQQSPQKAKNSQEKQNASWSCLVSIARSQGTRPMSKKH